MDRSKNKSQQWMSLLIYQFIYRIYIFIYIISLLSYSFVIRTSSGKNRPRTRQVWRLSRSQPIFSLCTVTYSKQNKYPKKKKYRFSMVYTQEAVQLKKPNPQCPMKNKTLKVIIITSLNIAIMILNFIICSINVLLINYFRRLM